MDISPIRVPGIGAVWQIAVEPRGELVRTAKVASPLYKQSGFVTKGWSRRFCVLKPMNMLFYFEGDDTESKGIVAVDEFAHVELVEEYEGRRNVIVVTGARR